MNEHLDFMALNLEHRVNFLKELSEWDMGLARLEFGKNENMRYFTEWELNTNNSVFSKALSLYFVVIELDNKPC